MHEDQLEELIIQAGEDGTDASLNQLLPIICRSLEETPESRNELSEYIELLLETWGDKAADTEARAAFCLQLAALDLRDSQFLRNALLRSLRRLAPPTLPKTLAAEAAGVRDKSCSPVEIAKRIDRLLGACVGNLACVNKYTAWGEITQLDEFTAEMALLVNGKLFKIPIVNALQDHSYFKPDPELRKMANAPAKTEINAESWRNILQANSLSRFPLEKPLLRQISISLFIPERFDLKSFNQWWQGGNCQESEKKLRHPADARSLAELKICLEQSVENAGLTITTQAEIKQIAKLMSGRKLQTVSQLTDTAECLALVSRITPDDQLFKSGMRQLFTSSPLFVFPDQDEERAKSEQAWRKITLARMPGFVEACRKAMPDEQCLDLLMHLPLKCWNAFSEIFGHESIVQTLQKSGRHPANAIIWIWRNRATVSKINIGQYDVSLILQAIAGQGRGARQLCEIFVDDESFQKAVIDASLEQQYDAADILAGIQHSAALSTSEKQSLLVKLARHYEQIRQILDAGEGKSIIGDTIKREQQADTAENNEPQITSLRSFRQRMKELEHLVNKEFPENTAAIAHARAYGDLRENAEYKAAKERQKFLTRRHLELERDLNNVQAVDFANAKPDEYVIPGSCFSLSFDSGEKEEYILLGLWDGDPTKHHISYDSGLGKLVNGQKAGSKINLPDGRSATLENIRALSQDLIEELSYG